MGYFELRARRASVVLAAIGLAGWFAGLRGGPVLSRAALLSPLAASLGRATTRANSRSVRFFQFSRRKRCENLVVLGHVDDGHAVVREEKSAVLRGKRVQLGLAKRAARDGLANFLETRGRGVVVTHGPV